MAAGQTFLVGILFVQLAVVLLLLKTGTCIGVHDDDNSTNVNFGELLHRAQDDGLISETASLRLLLLAANLTR